MKSGIAFGIIGMTVGGFFLTRNYYLNYHEKRMQDKKNLNQYKVTRFLMKQGFSKEDAEKESRDIIR